MARNDSFHCIDTGADVGSPSQRCGLIEQPIDSGLFDSLLARPLLAFKV
jgi:hypothetical protein